MPQSLVIHRHWIHGGVSWISPDSYGCYSGKNWSGYLFQELRVYESSSRLDERHHHREGERQTQKYQSFLLSPIRQNDNPARLVDAGTDWLQLKWSGSVAPNQTRLDAQPWSDAYWPLYSGALAWRYADKELRANNWQDYFNFSHSQKPLRSIIRAKTVMTCRQQKNMIFWLEMRISRWPNVHAKSGGILWVSWAMWSVGWAFAMAGHLPPICFLDQSNRWLYLTQMEAACFLPVRYQSSRDITMVWSAV